MYIVYFLVGILVITLAVVVLWLLGKLGSYLSGGDRSRALDYFEEAVGLVALCVFGYLMVFVIYTIGAGVVNHFIK